MKGCRFLQGRKQLVLWCGALVFVLVALASASSAQAQTASLATQMQTLQQSMAANQQRLQQYEWMEVRTVTIDGNDGPQQTYICRFGGDGRVIRRVMGGPPPTPGFDFNTELVTLFGDYGEHSLRDYMGQVTDLLNQYTPLNLQHVQSMALAGSAKVTNDSGSGLVNIDLHDYARPGDEVIVSFDPVAGRLVNVTVNSYVGKQKAKDGISLMVNYAMLPDGTTHVQKAFLQVNAKNVNVTSKNENYRPAGM